MSYPGIKILVIRREYSDMENSIIDPILKAVATTPHNYNKSDHLLSFANGSQIKFGNMPGYGAAVAGRYQGQEHDVVFLEEATQFTESEFRGIAAVIRGANKFPKRMYLTCNPGGIGHFWVKRLFIDRKFKDGEDPKDYVFISATVDDNKDLMKANPDYVRQLELLPEDIRRAHRYGDWNALSGVYFEEFTEGVHTCKPFSIPPHWMRYRAMDYGLDMFFCIWVAVDETGRCFVYRQFEQSNMVVSDAARKQLDLTRSDEDIGYTIAPPDMWSRSSDTGKSRANAFMKHGVALVRADNNRVQGWSALKELFKIRKDGRPGLIIFDNCSSLIDCLKSLQHDRTVPDDVAKQPHEITHGPDALRYFAQTYVLPADVQIALEEAYDDDEPGTDYQTAMCGTGLSMSYIRG
jgi:phage terminase large subunit